MSEIKKFQNNDSLDLNKYKIVNSQNITNINNNYSTNNFEGNIDYVQYSQYAVFNNTNTLLKNLFSQKYKLNFLDYSVLKLNFDSILYGNGDLNLFGADQGYPLNAYEYYNGKVAFVDVVKAYFPDMTDEDIYDYLVAINNTGCGYAALANYIIEAYKDNPEQFEKDFGFPIAFKYNNELYLSTNYLMVDIYCYAHKNNLLLSDNSNNYSSIAFYGNSESSNGTSIDDLQNILQSDRYKKCNIVLSRLKEEGPIKSPETGDIIKASDEKTINEISYLLKNSHNVEIAATDFDLYYVDNNDIVSIEPSRYRNAPHWMTITGVTDDNKYVVSTWGKKYILDPNSIDDSFGCNITTKLN